MHVSGQFTNPDTRPLPPGWTEHFDQRRGIWFYQFNTNPPRISLAHPAGIVSSQPQIQSQHITVSPGQAHANVRNQATQQPVSHGAGASTGRGKMSFAQMLYASAVPTTVNSGHGSMQSQAHSRAQTYPSIVRDQMQIQDNLALLPTQDPRAVSLASRFPAAAPNNSVVYGPSGSVNDGVIRVVDNTSLNSRPILHVLPNTHASPPQVDSHVNNQTHARSQVQHHDPQSQVQLWTQAVSQAGARSPSLTQSSASDFTDPPIQPYSPSISSVGDDVERNRGEALSRLERSSLTSHVGDNDAQSRTQIPATETPNYAQSVEAPHSGDPLPQTVEGSLSETTAQGGVYVLAYRPPEDEESCGNFTNVSPDPLPSVAEDADIGDNGDSDSSLPVYSFFNGKGEQSLSQTPDQTTTSLASEPDLYQDYQHRDQNVPRYAEHEERVESGVEQAVYGREQEDVVPSGVGVAQSYLPAVQTSSSPPLYNDGAGPVVTEGNVSVPSPTPSQTASLSPRVRTRIQRNVSGPRLPSSRMSSSSNGSYRVSPQVSSPPPGFLSIESSNVGSSEGRPSPVVLPPETGVMVGGGEMSNEDALLDHFQALRLDMQQAASTSTRPAGEGAGFQHILPQPVSTNATTIGGISHHHQGAAPKHSSTMPLTSAERRHQLRRQQEALLNQGLLPGHQGQTISNMNTVQPVTASAPATYINPSVSRLSEGPVQTNALGINTASVGPVSAATVAPAIVGTVTGTGMSGSQKIGAQGSQDIMSVQHTGTRPELGSTLAANQNSPQLPNPYAQAIGVTPSQVLSASPTTLYPQMAGVVPTQPQLSGVQQQLGTNVQYPFNGLPPLHPLRPNMTGGPLPSSYYEQMSMQSSTTKPPKTLKQRLTKLSEKTLSSLSNLKMPAQFTLSPSLKADIARIRKSPLLRKAVTGTTAVAGMTGAVVVNVMTAGLTASVLRREAVLRMAAAVGDLVAGKEESASNGASVTGDTSTGIVFDPTTGIIIDTTSGVCYDPSTGQFYDSSGSVFGLDLLLGQSPTGTDASYLYDTSTTTSDSSSGEADVVVLQAAVGVLGDLAGAILANTQAQLQQQTQVQVLQAQATAQPQGPILGQVTGNQVVQPSITNVPLSQVPTGGQVQPVYSQLGTSNTPMLPSSVSQAVKPQIAQPAPPKQDSFSLPPLPSKVQQQPAPVVQNQVGSQTQPVLPAQAQAQAQAHTLASSPLISHVKPQLHPQAGLSTPPAQVPSGLANASGHTPHAHAISQPASVQSHGHSPSFSPQVVTCSPAPSISSLASIGSKPSSTGNIQIGPPVQRPSLQPLRLTQNTGVPQVLYQTQAQAQSLPPNVSTTTLLIQGVPSLPNLSELGNQVQGMTQMVTAQPIRPTFTGQPIQGLYPVTHGGTLVNPSFIPQNAQTLPPAVPPKPPRPLWGFKPADAPPPRPQLQAPSKPGKQKTSWFGTPADVKPPPKPAVQPIQNPLVPRPPQFGQIQQQQQTQQLQQQQQQQQQQQLQQLQQQQQQQQMQELQQQQQLQELQQQQQQLQQIQELQQQQQQLQELQELQQLQQLQNAYQQNQDLQMQQALQQAQEQYQLTQQLQQQILEQTQAQYAAALGNPPTQSDALQTQLFGQINGTNDSGGLLDAVLQNVTGGTGAEQIIGQSMGTLAGAAGNFLGSFLTASDSTTSTDTTSSALGNIIGSIVAGNTSGGLEGVGLGSDDTCSDAY